MGMKLAWVIQLLTLSGLKAMTTQRIFKVADFIQVSDDEPIRSVITRSEDSAVVAWYVKPGQRLTAHTHPAGQDTWIIASGIGQYQLDANGPTKFIEAGDVVIAHRGQTHGVYNHGPEPLVFTSVVAPSEAGYEVVTT
jgi:quercetin dioxygenase-like cupin family protein